MEPAPPTAGATAGATAGSTAEPAARSAAAEEAAWLPLDRVFFVLQEQEAIEPGSSFGDQLLVRLPGKTPGSEPGGTLVAARLDLVVQSKDGGYWAATSVVAVDGPV